MATVAPMVPQLQIPKRNAAAAPLVPEMGDANLDYDDFTMNLPFSPLLSARAGALKMPSARLSGLDGLFEFAFDSVGNTGSQCVPDMDCTAASVLQLARRRSSAARLAQELGVNVNVKSEPEGMGMGTEPATPTPTPISDAVAASFSTRRPQRSSRSNRSFAPMVKPACMKKTHRTKVTMVLPEGHKPARGRGRSKQLATMSQAQKKAEQAVRMEKNRQAAKEFRARRKNRIQDLEATVEAHIQRNEQQQTQIRQLQQQILQLNQMLA